MNLYKTTIRPVSSYCSPLQSDTFFGAFCWSYLYECGEDALNRLIHNYKKREPEIIFSNAFPKNRLPVPTGMVSSWKDNNILDTKQERYQKYIASKEQKQSATVPLELFNKIINGGSNDEYTLAESASEPKTDISMGWRNMVCRQTDTVENIDGASSLFETEQYFTNGAFDVYIYSKFDKTLLETVLKKMFQYGIGAQRSVGKGAFKMEGGIEVFDGIQYPPEADAFIAFSNFIPNKDDPTDGYYKAFVKYPKVSVTDRPGDSPFKKPLIFLKAGSVFRTCNIKRFYGSCIENIALKEGVVSEKIVIGAYTIVVPCRLGKHYNMEMK